MADTTVEGMCTDCGRFKHLRWNHTTGQGRCRNCRARRSPTEPCSGCGRDRRVNARTADGAALCGTCYVHTRTSTELCDGCSTIGPLTARAGGRSSTDRDLCATCYRTPTRRCCICGRTRRVALAATTTHGDICPTCYQAPVVACSVCGDSGLGRRTTNNGRPLCFGCDAATKIDALLAGPDGHLPAGLARVRDAIVQTDRPRSILSNLHSSGTLELLAAIAHGRVALTHEALDDHRAGFAVTYLRSLLVATGALPQRDEHLARLERFTTTLLETIDTPADRWLLSRYARWHVIGRAKPDRHGLIRASVADRCRQDIRTARAFLDHLAHHGQNTHDGTQASIDAWIVQARSRKLTFLRWLQANGHLTAINLPEPAPATHPASTADDERRWQLIRRLLHDPDSASIEDRAAACLILLYAQPVAKIVQLTINDRTVEETGSYLRLGPEPLLLIPPLDTLLTALPLTKPFGAAQALADPRWLFPGKKAGHHLHPASLVRRMNQLSITTRSGRNTAMLHLAATTPPAIFASLIGINATTAVRWTHASGSNWMTYTASRNTDLAPPPPATD